MIQNVYREQSSLRGNSFSNRYSRTAKNVRSNTTSQFYKKMRIIRKRDGRKASQQTRIMHIDQGLKETRVGILTPTKIASLAHTVKTIVPQKQLDQHVDSKQQPEWINLESSENEQQIRRQKAENAAPVIVTSSGGQKNQQRTEQLPSKTFLKLQEIPAQQSEYKQESPLQQWPKSIQRASLTESKKRFHGFSIVFHDLYRKFSGFIIGSEGNNIETVGM